MSLNPIQVARLPVVPAYVQYGDPITDPATALGFVSFDVVLSEEHERGASITDHPVEEGINVVDHVRILPDRLTLEVYVSNAPIGSTDAIRAPITLDLPQPDPDGGALGALAGGTSAAAMRGLQGLGLLPPTPTLETVLVDQFISPTDYVRQTYETLTFLRDGAIMCSIHTPRATYQNMLIERIEMHRDAGTGTGANMSIEFREVRIVQSSVTNAPLPTILRSSPPTNLGKKDSTPLDGPKTSVALKALQNFGLASSDFHPTGIPVPSP